MDPKMYPTGSGGLTDPLVGNLARRQRFRTLTANVNAGAVLLPALAGWKWIVTDLIMIAIGGAATTATSVDVLATLAGASRKLLSVAVAALTQSAVVRAGAANATVLADGASFTVNDANAAVSIGVTGSAMTVATAIDVILEYQAIAA